MPKPKGPKIELPEDLAAELEDAAAEQTQPTMQTAEGTPAAAEGGEESPAQALQRELDALKDRYLRLAADFENYKRRSLKEREDLYNYGNENLIKELIETVDNLERALGHAQGSEEGVDGKTLVEGVQLTHRSLMRALEKFGLQRVEAEGEPFDPQVHEAIRQVESDEHPTGTVVAVDQKGYLLKDRLLRPALVGVSRRTEGESE
jgi:molecular chaperone GrpE